ncbi:HNH endonuclease [Shimazuella kribbensis]|uniref:HNH endonuclease n=1 Tax=Shimazuella kribbensis TaxID=139808 RepID=UPI000686AB75|nr:HNH endonuclease [Shimazuella kribbensis]
MLDNKNDIKYINEGGYIAKKRAISPIRYVINNGCWLYQPTKEGRPATFTGLKRYNKYWSPRRYVYTLHNGAIADKLRIITTCGNRDCLRPEHLRAVKPIDASPVVGKHYKNKR